MAEASVRNLAGFSVHADRVTGDKCERAAPLTAQCEAGNVRLLRGPWNQRYLEELCAFPLGSFADQVDASSGAFNKLARGTLWTHEQMAAYARGDDLYGPEWGDPPGWVPPGFTPPPPAGQTAEPLTAQEQYLADVAAQDVERRRRLALRGW